MKVRVKEIVGIADAFESMTFSKSHWDWDICNRIYSIVDTLTDRHGRYLSGQENITCITAADENIAQYEKWWTLLKKYGKEHITLLKFIDISCSVEGLHRAGQDDWDAHAERYNNRIIRASSREAKTMDGKSTYYEGKILSLEDVVAELETPLPEKISRDGKIYVRTYNGYILETEKNNPDVRRGLYMESFPSNFTFKCNLAEFAHVYRLRNEEGHAHPEVKQLAEEVLRQVISMQPFITKEWLLTVEN